MKNEHAPIIEYIAADNQNQHQQQSRLDGFVIFSLFCLFLSSSSQCCMMMIMMLLLLKTKVDGWMDGWYILCRENFQKKSE